MAMVVQSPNNEQRTTLSGEMKFFEILLPVSPVLSPGLLPDVEGWRKKFEEEHAPGTPGRVTGGLRMW